MTVTRTVVVQLWTGSLVVRRLRFDEADQAAYVDTLADSDVTANLRRLGVAVPSTVEEQRAALRDWPTVVDLDAIATAWTAVNDGVRPVVRVLENASLPSAYASAAGASAAGSVS